MKAINQLMGLALALSTLMSFSQNGIGYKALVKDNSGNAITSQSITVKFLVLKGAGLTNVYQETHNPTTDANGFVMVNIGEGTVDSGVFTDIDWGSDEHHLGVLIDTGGGWIDLGTTPFRAVPYALNVASEAMRINDLNDGKSDFDGTEDGSSIFLGIGAGLNDDGTDNKNVGIGFESLFANTIGYLNSSLGYQSLQNNSSGAFNSAIGASALGSNTSGGNNTAVGYQTLKNNTTGGNNTAMGMNAVFYNITGSQNVAIGNSALLSLESGFGNTAVGFDAGRNSTGDGNIYIGQYAGRYNTGSYRLFIESSDADPNNALVYGEFGTDNTTTGNIFRTNSEFQVGNPTLTGYAFPTADGAADQVLRTDGSGALTWSDDAQSIDDLDDARSDGSSIFLGLYAGLNDDTDNYNLGIGLNSLAANNTGYTNTAIGTNTLRNNTTGYSNVGIGSNTLFNLVSGGDNTAVGFQVLYNNTTGFQNVGIGSSALNSIESGSLNVALGNSAGYKTTGNSNIFVGHRAGYNELGSEKLYIENSSADANNALIYGEFNNNILRTNGQFQVGNPALTGYAFPTADGAADQVLRTDGSGSLNWDSTSEPSGLEALNEGNGIGWRFIGTNPSYYGNIGSGAVDLSYSNDPAAVGATGNFSTALGYRTTASNTYSFSAGYTSTASGIGSVAMGSATEAAGDYSTAMGDATSTLGYASTSLGFATIATSSYVTALGRYNVGNGNPLNWIGSDPLFEVGNGSWSARANALTILKNGNTSIGVNSPGSHRLYVKSAGTQSSGSTGLFENTASAGLAMVIQNTSSASIDNALLVSNHGTGPIASFDSWQGNNTWNRRFKFTNAGDGRCDGSWIGGGADYAEYFPKARNYDNFEPGDVIAMSEITGYSVEMATTEDPRLIIGVYSSNPLVVGNSTAEEDPENHVLVGLMGVVSTKVNAENGPIAIGDFLKLSSTPGVAAKALESGYMIGRALESHSHSTQGMIKVLVEPEWMEFDKEMIAVTPELEQTLQELGYASHGFSAKDDQDQLRLPYNDLIVLLNKAIKVQQQRIEKQDSELSELKAWKERVDRLLGLAEN